MIRPLYAVGLHVRRRADVDVNASDCVPAIVAAAAAVAMTVTRGPRALLMTLPYLIRPLSRIPHRLIVIRSDQQ